MDGFSDQSALGNASATQALESEPNTGHVPPFDEILPHVRRERSVFRRVVGPALVLAVLLLSLSPHLRLVDIKAERKKTPDLPRPPAVESPVQEPDRSEVMTPVIPAEPSEDVETSVGGPSEASALVPFERLGGPLEDALRTAFKERVYLGALFPDGSLSGVDPAPFFKDLDYQIRQKGEAYAAGVKVNLAAYARLEIEKFPRLAFRIYQGQGAVGVRQLGLFLSYRNIAQTIDTFDAQVYQMLYEVLEKFEHLEDVVQEYGELSAIYEKEAEAFQMEVMTKNLSPSDKEYNTCKEKAVLARDAALAAGIVVQEELKETMAALVKLKTSNQGMAFVQAFGVQIDGKKFAADVARSIIEAAANLFRTVIDGRSVDSKAKAYFIFDEFEAMLQYRIHHTENCLEILKNFGCSNEVLVGLLGNVQQSTAAIDVARWNLARTLSRLGLPLFFAAAV